MLTFSTETALDDVEFQMISEMFVMELCHVPQEDDYVGLAAMHYHIQFGPAYNREGVQRAVEECIATQLLERRGPARWIDLVSSAHLQVRWRPVAQTQAPGQRFR